MNPSATTKVRVLSENEIGTAIIHLYRGELGRLTTYRSRLDTTTNWAVGSTAGIVTFVLGNRAIPHFVMGLALVLWALFLNLETRRYLIYATIRERVRLLEQGYYSAVLGETCAVPSWQKQIRESLLSPRAPLGRIAAAGVRMRRNYGGLLAALVGAWLLKLGLTEGQSWTEAARVGALPGVVALGFVACLVVLAAYVTWQGPTEQD